MKPIELLGLKATLHKSKYVSESIDDTLKARLKNFLKIDGCSFNIYELLLNGAVLDRKYLICAEQFLFGNERYQFSNYRIIGNNRDVYIDVPEESIEKIVDILCGVGYISLPKMITAQKITAYRKIYFHHSVRAYRCIHVNVIKPENIGDAEVFGFDMMKSDLDELAVQLGHSNGVYRELKVLRERGGQPSQRVVEIVRRYIIYDELKALNEKHIELKVLNEKHIELKALNEKHIELKALNEKHIELKALNEKHIELKALNEKHIELKALNEKNLCKCGEMVDEIVGYEYQYEIECIQMDIIRIYNKYHNIIPRKDEIVGYEIMCIQTDIIRKYNKYHNIILDFQYYDFYMNYIIFPKCQFADGSKSTPTTLYNAYCEYIAMKYHIFESPIIYEYFTKAEFTEKIADMTGISQIDDNVDLTYVSKLKNI